MKMMAIYCRLLGRQVRSLNKHISNQDVGMKGRQSAYLQYPHTSEFLTNATKISSILKRENAPRSGAGEGLTSDPDSVNQVRK
jgi:hypothetical protein